MAAAIANARSMEGDETSHPSGAAPDSAGVVHMSRLLSPDGAQTSADLDSDAFDRVLIGAMAQGEADAMALFYDRHAPFVQNVLRSLLDDRALADDVLQEVFWQAWRTAGRYDPLRGSPRTWLYQMARTRALDARRRRGREEPTAATESADPDPAAEGVFAAVESRQWFAQVRQVLSTDEEAVVRLVFDRGLTQAEAARHLGIPLGTAKGRIRSALKRLRRLLETVERPENGAREGRDRHGSR